MGIPVKVTLQGVSSDLKSANGSYDPVELGPMDSDQLFTLLNQVAPLKPPDMDAGDFCPPTFLVETPSGLQTFTVGDRRVYHLESESWVGPTELIQVITGQFNTRARLAQNQAAAGVAPATPGVLPTDPDLDPRSIDTGPSTPQFSLKVWKGDGWRTSAIVIPILALMLMVGPGFLLIFAEGGKEAGLGVGLILVGMLLVGLSVPLWIFGKGQLRAGVDWRTNTIWVLRPGRKLAYEVNAANILGFLANKRVTDMGMVRTTKGYKRNVKVTHEVLCKRTTSEYLMPVNGGKCTTKAEAEDLARGLDGLLRRR